MSALKKKTNYYSEEEEAELQYIEVVEKDKIKLLKSKQAAKKPSQQGGKAAEQGPAPAENVGEKKPKQLFQDDRQKFKPKLIDQEQFEQREKQVVYQQKSHDAKFVQKKRQQQKQQASIQAVEGNQTTNKYQQKQSNKPVYGQKKKGQINNSYQNKILKGLAIVNKEDIENYIYVKEKSVYQYLQEVKVLIKKFKFIALKAVGKENICKAILIAEEADSELKNLTRINIPGIVRAKDNFVSQDRHTSLQLHEQQVKIATFLIELSVLQNQLNKKHIGFQSKNTESYETKAYKIQYKEKTGNSQTKGRPEYEQKKEKAVYEQKQGRRQWAQKKEGARQKGEVNKPRGRRQDYQDERDRR